MNIEEKKAEYVKLIEDKKFHMRCMLAISGRLQQLRSEIHEVEPNYVVSGRDWNE